VKDCTTWIELALVRSIFFSAFGVAEGAEGFEDFGDVGGFGAEELFGEGFGGGGAEGGFDGFSGRVHGLVLELRAYRQISKAKKYQFPIFSQSNL
jgi:hypothetical protein